MLSLRYIAIRLAPVLILGAVLQYAIKSEDARQWALEPSRKATAEARLQATFAASDERLWQKTQWPYMPTPDPTIERQRMLNAIATTEARYPERIRPTATPTTAEAPNGH